MNSVLPLLRLPRVLLLLSLLALQQIACAGDGYVTTDFAQQNDGVRQGAILVDGAIISFGGVSGASTNGQAIGVTRHFDTGLPDTAFGTGGKVVVPNYRDYQDAPAAGIVQSDGKLIVAGVRTNRTGSRGSAYWLVVRLNQDGSLDKTFNKTGYAMTAIYSASKVLEQCVLDVTLQSDGKILAVGDYVPVSGGSVAALARYNTTGSLDATFGSAGVVKPSLGVFTSSLDAVTLQDNKILAVGWCYTRERGRDLLLMRFNSNGSLDSSFHGGGIVRTQFTQAPNLYGRDVKILPGGRILVGVEGLDDLGIWPGLVCYDANGNLDTGFGIGGLAATHLTSPDETSFNALAVQSDGMILVAGTQLRANGTPDPDQGIVLQRYRPDGSLDSYFGVGGVVVDWTAASGDVRTDADGRIVVFGHKFVSFPDDPSQGSDDFFVARYCSDGAPDLEFGY